MPYMFSALKKNPTLSLTLEMEQRRAENEI